MLYIILFISIILLIIGANIGKVGYRDQDDNGFTIGGTFLLVISIVALCVCWGIYSFNKNTIDSRLSVIEEQNAVI